MIHNCASYECYCEHCESCHAMHKWTDWTVYPECDLCLVDMARWIHEQTDYPGCPVPELCDYSPACVAQYEAQVYGCRKI